MKASRVMTKTVHCISPTDTLEHAWQLMQRHRVRHLPVTWGEKLTGILSDRDLLAFSSRGVGGELVFPAHPVSDAMTTKPFTALHDATVSALARLMLDARIDCVPIVTRGDELIGLVTSFDLLELLSDPVLHSDRVPFEYEIRTAAALT